jgi:thiamine-monophosphate kinase
LRALATAPAARGLLDDAAVAPFPLGDDLVATHDVLVAGVHYTPGCPPEDVGWKLAAVNASDLAATGARPLGMLLGLALGPAEDAAWIDRFARGLGQAIDAFGLALWGGDTVRTPGPAVLGLTALGAVRPGTALGRSGARSGDHLWVSGTIGDAGAGLALALDPVRGGTIPPGVARDLLARYRRPAPRLALGRAMVGIAHAAMDVSDGLLLDARRMGEASGVAVEIEADAVPRSRALARWLEARPEEDPLAPLAAGDDYELLLAAAPDDEARLRTAAARSRTPITLVGQFLEGEGLRLTAGGRPLPLPARLGFEH